MLSCYPWRFYSAVRLFRFGKEALGSCCPTDLPIILSRALIRTFWISKSLFRFDDSSYSFDYRRSRLGFYDEYFFCLFALTPNKVCLLRNLFPETIGLPRGEILSSSYYISSWSSYFVTLKPELFLLSCTHGATSGFTSCYYVLLINVLWFPLSWVLIDLGLRYPSECSWEAVPVFIYFWFIF